MSGEKALTETESRLMDIIKLLESRTEQKDEEIEACKFILQGKKNAVKELSDMGVILHNKNKQLQKDKAELVHALEDMDILLDIDDYLWTEEDDVLRQKSKAIADKHKSIGEDE